MCPERRVTLMEKQKTGRPQNSSYRWIIVLAGIAGLFASLGLGRFSLGMMLPAMGEGLALSYSQMGLISTINFCGYLMAVLLCGVLTARFGARLLIAIALMLVALSMVLVGFSSHYIGYPAALFSDRDRQRSVQCADHGPYCRVV